MRRAPALSSFSSALAIFLSLLLLWLEQRYEGQLSASLRAFVAPLQASTGRRGYELRQLFGGYLELDALHEERQRLQRQLSARGQLEVMNQELRAENDRLRAMLAFRRAWPRYQLIPGRVVHRSQRSHLQLLELSLGDEPLRWVSPKRSEGAPPSLDPTERPQLDPAAGPQLDTLRSGLAVVADGALVGTVKQVQGELVEIILTSGEESSVDVVLEESRIRGSATGLGLGRGFQVRLDRLQRTRLAIEGERALTTGREGLYPAGLIVGWVVNVRRQESGLFQSANLVPRFAPDALEELFILVGEETASPSLEGEE